MPIIELWVGEGGSDLDRFLLSLGGGVDAMLELFQVVTFEFDGSQHVGVKEVHPIHELPVSVEAAA